MLRSLVGSEMCIRDRRYLQLKNCKSFLTRTLVMCQDCFMEYSQKDERTLKTRHRYKALAAAGRAEPRPRTGTVTARATAQSVPVKSSRPVSAPVARGIQTRQARQSHNRRRRGAKMETSESSVSDISRLMAELGWSQDHIPASLDLENSQRPKTANPNPRRPLTAVARRPQSAAAGRKLPHTGGASGERVLPVRGLVSSASKARGRAVSSHRLKSGTKNQRASEAAVPARWDTFFESNSSNKKKSAQSTQLGRTSQEVRGLELWDEESSDDNSETDFVRF
eukprot:TRINITY_DN24965_c0_g1_i1.p1 TRINITY_DN24965_c0_g1~~TRINITY_DN24965_c0_g1_i1.p1  ORF type:complete len:281 (+),score=18.28 TRINITY_DN24965_c0_g1_i1:95-937(+)